MKSIHPHLFVLALVGSTGACMDEAEDGPDDSFVVDGKADGAITEGSPEAMAVLRIANGASAANLHTQVGLSTTAAKKIGAFRVGPDGLAGTADDRVITTLAQLDAIPYIGPVAFRELIGYAKSFTWQQQFPAQFSWSLTVQAPVNAISWTSIAISGSDIVKSQMAKSLAVGLVLTNSGSSIKISRANAPDQYKMLDANGAFDFSFQSSKVSADGRNLSFEQMTFTGKIDPLGQLVITQYDDRSGGGNSIYGYNGTTTHQTGGARVALPYVDAAPAR